MSPSVTSWLSLTRTVTQGANRMYAAKPPTGSEITLQDVLERLAEADIGDSRRRDLRSAVATCAASALSGSTTKRSPASLPSSRSPRWSAACATAPERGPELERFGRACRQSRAQAGHGAVVQAGTDSRGLGQAARVVLRGDRG